MAGESFKKTRGELTPEARAYHEGFEAGKKLGVKEGQVKERGAILDELQRIYMQPSVRRGSAEAAVVLALSQELANYYRAHPLATEVEVAAPGVQGGGE